MVTMEIDKDQCIRCGLCVAICPEICELRDDGKAKIKSQKSISCIKEAIENCPIHAIKK